MKKSNEDILICECHSTEHQLIVLYSNEDEYPMVYFHIHLNKRSFWERLKYGIKYIFGYQSQYGAFQEFILNPEDSHKLERVVKYLKDEKTV
jgi:hypothetical protein